MRLLAAAFVVATPAGAQAPVSSAPGVSARIGEAISRGDEPGLLQLTGGAIYTRLTLEARRSGITRMSASELISRTRGCRLHSSDEPAPDPAGRPVGAVEFRCVGSPSPENRCDDIGYGLLLKPQPGYVRVEVWSVDMHSTSRCGPAGAPPPLPVRQPVPRQ